MEYWYFIAKSRRVVRKATTWFPDVPPIGRGVPVHEAVRGPQFSDDLAALADDLLPEPPDLDDDVLSWDDETHRRATFTAVVPQPLVEAIAAIPDEDLEAVAARWSEFGDLGDDPLVLLQELRPLARATLAAPRAVLGCYGET